MGFPGNFSNEIMALKRAHPQSMVLVNPSRPQSAVSTTTTTTTGVNIPLVAVVIVLGLIGLFTLVHLMRKRGE
jgi:broad specificity polyphosphatase/5'/3'-nucleotidase SurE